MAGGTQKGRGQGPEPCNHGAVRGTAHATPTRMPTKRRPTADGPYSMPWTVHLPVDGGYRAADLEHPAPLPRIGERVEYIDETGQRQLYRVVEVIHTLQSAADTRPPVSAGGGSPNATPRLGQAPEAPGGDGLVRAGLPRVYLAIDPEEQT